MSTTGDHANSAKPAIVLVNGAFADASSAPDEGERLGEVSSGWAVVVTADKAAGTDIVRLMAQRAGADIVEVEGSHVIMVSQSAAVTDVIVKAAQAVAGSGR